MRLLEVTLSLGLMAMMSPAQVQTMSPPAGMTDDSCLPPMQGPPPGMAASILQPGAKPPVMGPISDNDPQLKAYLKKHTEDMLRDYGGLCHFKSANAAQLESGSPRVVLTGDSITALWEMGDPSLFSGRTIDRGIGGQTSPQMLVRFYQDVVALKPEVVHIMAGTNDLAGNTGPNSPEDFKNNIRAMVDLAQANGIKVIVASILPVDRFTWRPDLHPAEQVRKLNAWLREFAAERGIVFADYYSAMATDSGGLKPELSNDGVHPTTRGYAVMRPIFEQAVNSALKERGS